MPNGEIWDRYWRHDRIASCFDGAGARNYDDGIAAPWRAFFAALPARACILDLCTGNGAAALIAAADGRAARIIAVDQADIDPAACVSRHSDLYARIDFRGRTDVTALPFGDGGFDAVVSQYGIEYCDPDKAIPEAVRMLAPGGRLRFVVHAAEGSVAADARRAVADADLLLDRIDLCGRAVRCFEAVLAAERGGGDGALADRSLADFREALGRVADHLPQAADQVMLRNSGAVLLDAFAKRGHFGLDELVAKAEEVRAEVEAHRGRLVALLEAALDSRGAEALADRLGAMGGVAASRPLESDGKLIAHVVAARFH